jgi:hypothetical protein
LVQQLKTLRHGRGVECGYICQVSARPIETAHEPEPDRVGAN